MGKYFVDLTQDKSDRKFSRWEYKWKLDPVVEQAEFFGRNANDDISAIVALLKATK